MTMFASCRGECFSVGALGKQNLCGSDDSGRENEKRINRGTRITMDL